MIAHSEQLTNLFENIGIKSGYFLVSTELALNLVDSTNASILHDITVALLVLLNNSCGDFWNLHPIFIPTVQLLKYCV